MDASTTATDSDQSSLRSAPSVIRSRTLAAACAQLTQSPNPQSLFSTLDHALTALYGPDRYALWRASSPDGLERVDGASREDGGSSSRPEATPRRLSRSAWESLFVRDGAA